MTCSTLDTRAGSNLYFKCETFQKRYDHQPVSSLAHQYDSTVTSHQSDACSKAVESRSRTHSDLALSHPCTCKQRSIQFLRRHGFDLGTVSPM